MVSTKDSWILITVKKDFRLALMSKFWTTKTISRLGKSGCMGSTQLRNSNWIFNFLMI